MSNKFHQNNNLKTMLVQWIFIMYNILSVSIYELHKSTAFSLQFMDPYILQTIFVYLLSIHAFYPQLSQTTGVTISCILCVSFHLGHSG